MISKELLSEVIKRNIINIKTSLDDYIINENIVRYWDDKSVVHFEINIYELAHKCKEWALKKGYPFNVLYRYDYWDRCEPKYDIDLYNHRKSFRDDIEYNAIFKACEWILQKKEQ